MLFIVSEINIRYAHENPVKEKKQPNFKRLQLFHLVNLFISVAIQESLSRMCKVTPQSSMPLADTNLALLTGLVCGRQRLGPRQHFGYSPTFFSHTYVVFSIVHEH